MGRITRARVRSDFQYARALMRQAETAFRTTKEAALDLEELSEVAHELVASTTTMLEYVQQQQTQEAD